MSAITTHILDVAAGTPAANVSVTLWHRDDNEWTEIGRGVTDSDGRVGGLLVDQHELVAGTYQLVFETGDYFAGRDIDTFYPRVTVAFTVSEAREHYHVPLLLSPHGYSTYRGS
jgi:5-hydroxyisourate hydrolase